MKKGFTLVELMIVIAIIALLSGIILTSTTGSKAKSRDARRISDLNQIQLALEQYFDRCGQYPTVDNNLPSTSSTCNVGGTSVTINSYISVIPSDPTNDATHKYSYAVNNSSNPTDYILHATLESSNAAQQNSYPKSALTTFVTNAKSINPSYSDTTWSCFDSSVPSGTDYCVSTH